MHSGDASNTLVPVNNRHRKTLVAIFADPVSGTIEWAAIEALFVAVGCRVLTKSGGSRVKFIHGDVVAAFHRPHPAKEAKQYQVRDAREFLIKIGVQP